MSSRRTSPEGAQADSSSAAPAFPPAPSHFVQRLDPGFIYVMSVPYVAGISSIGDFQIAGFRYSGWIWATMLAAGGLLILARKERIRFPVVLWLPWLGFVMLSLAWVQGYSLRNFQDAFQIVTPLVVGVVASMRVRSKHELRRLRKAFTHCLIIASAGYLVTLSGVFGGLSLAQRAMAMMACFVGCVFAATFGMSPVWSLAGWAGCLSLAFFTGSRMATVALLAIWVVHPLHRGPLARLVAVGMVAVLGCLAFYTPVFQERFFGLEQGSLSQVSKGEFDSAGRFESWPLIWQEAREHAVLGAGVGQSGKFVASVWPGTDQPHNDYLRIVFDQGFVGLVLFLAVVAWQFHHLHERIRRCRGEIRTAFAAAHMGLVVLLIIAFTDNPITYGVWYMHPLFAVLGGAYGAAGAANEAGSGPEAFSGGEAQE